MSAPKTRPTSLSVEAYLAAVEDPQRRADCEALVALMARITGQPPVMWGTGIVGFGSYHYRYASGREGQSCWTGFAARKGDISVYTQVGFEGLDAPMAALGRHKAAKSCLYVRRLADIRVDVLEQILRATVARVRARHPSAALAA